MVYLVAPLNDQNDNRSQRRALATVDMFVYAAILVLGAFYLYSHLRSSDFPFEDVAYYEQAKSILHDGYYGFNSVPERVQPPGLPLLLALICKIAPCRYGVLLSSMGVFLTLGLLVWYQIIRQVEGRGIAAATCLLLGASPWLFQFVTRGIFPSTPYILVSGLCLWIILKLEGAQTRLRRYLLAAALALIVGFAVLLQSAAIALVGAMLASVVFTWLRDRGKAVYRLKVFLPAILLGILTQYAWMHRGSNPPDWPLPGYPESYVTQLKLKLGNYPELGFASASDVFWRLSTNVRERTAVLAEMLTAHWIHRSYSSVAIAIPLILVFVGWVTSIWGTDACVLAWYFAGFEAIYILWPWMFEFRFFFPNAPLACLFLYRGAKKVAAWSRLYPRRVAVCFLPINLFLGCVAFLESRKVAVSLHSGVQSNVSFAFWLGASLFSVWLIWTNRVPSLFTWLPERGALRTRFSLGPFSLTPSQAGQLILGALVVTGAISQDIPIARENRAFGELGLERVPDVVAAQWVREHTDPKDVIAARHVPLVYHHSQRKVVWFAPIVHPEVMMEGVRRLNIHYIIVVDRETSYYLPPDTVCFDLVEKAYPTAFRLTAQLGKARVYEVVPAAVNSAAHP